MYSITSIDNHVILWGSIKSLLIIVSASLARTVQRFAWRLIKQSSFCFFLKKLNEEWYTYYMETEKQMSLLLP